MTDDAQGSPKDSTAREVFRYSKPIREPRQGDGLPAPFED
jgi:hypothetical protein